MEKRRLNLILSRPNDEISFKDVNNKLFRCFKVSNYKTILFLMLLLGGVAKQTFGQSKIIGIATDFDGFTESTTTTLNDVGTKKPNEMNNLLSFTVETATNVTAGTYSTGVDDAKLTTNSVTFNAGRYRAFVPSVAEAGNAGQGSNDDGDPNLYSAGPPEVGWSVGNQLYSTPGSGADRDVRAYLTDGEKGLGMSTFANNVGGTFTFDLTNIDPSEVGDGIPDLIYFNMAVPSTDNVEFAFYNGSTLVGTQTGRAEETGSNDDIINIINDRFKTRNGEQNKNTSIAIEQQVQGFVMELSDFNLTQAQMSTVTRMEVILPAQADPPFIAYNEDAFTAIDPNACTITDAGLASVTCNNNSTGIATDDFITFTLNPTATNEGATYNVSVSGGTINPTSASYGSATTFTLQGGSAGGGDVTVTLADVDDSLNCVLDVTVTDPGACSVGTTGTVTITDPLIVGGTATITVEDADLDTDTGSTQMVTVTVTNDNGESEDVILTETGNNTGVFQGTVATTYGATAGTDDDGTFNAAKDDILTATYNDALTASSGTASPTDSVTLTCTADNDGDGICDADDPDDDNDGVSDSVENAGPNGGDANGDGTPDSIQSNVASLVDASGNGTYVAIHVTSSDCDAITNVQAVSESSVSQDANFDYPVGLIDFTLQCVSEGATADVVFYWYGVSSINTFRKYGPSLPGLSDTAYKTSAATIVNATVGGVSVPTTSYSIIDNAAGDESAMAKEIIDPAGPAVSTIDTDGDSITDDIDFDDDNDGIPDSVECVELYARTNGISSNLVPGSADLVIDQYSDGTDMPSTVTLKDFTYGGPAGSNDAFITKTTPSYLRFANSGGYTDGESITTTVEISNPEIVVLEADNTNIGTTSFNQTDTFEFEVVGAPAGFEWVVESSTVASIVNSGNKITITGDLTSGTKGATPFVDFKISTNQEISEFTITHISNKDSAGSTNNGRVAIRILPDIDNDGISNCFDLDSDNDGIFDAVEAGHNQTQTNGEVNGTVGTDGIPDAVQASANAGTVNYTLADSEATADGTADYLELDADGDGCNDVKEAGFTDGDNNGLLGSGTFGSGLTVDGDGVVTSGSDGYTVLANTNYTDDSVMSACGGVTGTITITDPLNVGDTATVTVTDADLDTTGGADSIIVTVTNDNGESEDVTLNETGNNTGIFSGTVATTFGATAGTDDDGTFNVSATDVLTATYDDAFDANGNDPVAVTDTVTIGGGATGTITITDPLNVGDTATVTVTDADLDTTGGADSIVVTVTNDNGESEDVTLNETGNNTGIFSGTVATTFGATAGTDDDGTFNVSATDVLTATYDDAFDANGNDPVAVTDTVTIGGGATGTITITDPLNVGDTATVTVTDADLDTTGGADSIVVTVTNDNGESEDVTLNETGNNTGIFSGTVATTFGATAGTDDDGTFNVSATDVLTATYDDAFDANGNDPVAVTDTVTIGGGATGTITITDPLNVGDTATVTVTDADLDTTGSPDSIIVTVTNDNGESEDVTLNETGNNTGIFSGTVATTFGATAGTDDDGTFNVSATDVLTATYDDAFDANGNDPVAVTDTVTIGGGATGTITITDPLNVGDTATVTVTDADLDTTGGADSIVVTVTNDNGESEDVTLNETGNNTGIFSGTVATTFGATAGTDDDGTFNVSATDVLTATYDDAFDANGNDPVAVTDTVTIGGGATGTITITDPLNVGDTATVTVTDADLDTTGGADSIIVTVTNDNGESEDVTLNETGNNTGIFSGTVATTFGATAGTDDDGTFNVSATDVLTATYDDAFDANGNDPVAVTDTVTIGGGATGTITITDPLNVGDTATVTVTDADLDTTGGADSIVVTVTNDNGESEDVTLNETGNNTGIFSGTVATTFGATAGTDDDGTFNVSATDVLTATYDDAFDANGNDPVAVTDTVTIGGGATGTITITDPLNVGDTATVTVTDADLDTTGGADSIVVTVTNDNGESEDVTLNETGNNTGIFSGTVATTFGATAGTDDDGTFNVSATDVLTATYDDAFDANGNDPVAVTDTVTIGGGATGTITITDPLNVGDTATVTVTDADLDTTGSPDSIIVTVTNDNGESEDVTLNETGNNTGIFSGTVATTFGATAGTDDDGTFNVSATDVLTATYDDAFDANGNDPVAVTDTVTIGGGATGTITITDPLNVGDTATVTVTDADLDTTGGADSIVVTVTNDNGESEDVTLNETGNNTGIFSGTVATTFGATAGTDDDGTFNVSATDVLTATYDDAFDANGNDPVAVTDTVTIGGGATGTITITDPLNVGDTATVTVTDADLDTTGGADSIVVTVTNDNGESEDVTLNETGNNTGIFSGTVATTFGATAGTDDDGTFNVSATDVLTATYDDAFDANGNDPVAVTDTVTIGGGATGTITITDPLNVGDTATVTVTDADLDTTGGADSIVVTVTNDNGESEDVTLNETGNNTGIFSGTVATTFGATAGTDDDGTFNVSATDVLTATYDDAFDANGNDPVAVTDTVTIGGGATGTITITDPLNVGDTATVTVTDADLDTTGGADSIVVTVTNDNGESEDVTLNETGNNTGIFSGTVATTFGATAGTDDDGTFNVSATDVLTATYDDAFDANGNDPVAVTDTVTIGGGATGTITITDPLNVGDTATVTVTDADLDTTGSPDSIIVTVTNDNGESEDVTLNETGNNTGIFSGTVATTFGATAGTDDDGTFNVSATDVLTATYDDAFDANGNDPVAVTDTVTIGGAAKTVSITASDNTATEDSADDGEFTVTLDKVNDTGANIVIPVTLTGTATDGTDYTTFTNITIAPGDTIGTVDVDALSDSSIEVDETVIATLGTLPSGVTAGTSTNAAVTVKDAGTTVSITATDDTATEGGTDDGEFTITLGDTNTTGSDITITVIITGTATDGTDVTTVATSVTIADGSSSATININALTDSNIEVDETVIATLGTLPSGVTAGTSTNATVTVKDAGTTVSITATDDTATEGGTDDGEFTITLGDTNTTGSDITIPVIITGTATDGADVTTVATSVTIADGSSSATININALTDSNIEVDETVIATLGTLPSGVTAGTSTNATVTVKDAEATVNIVANNPTSTEGETDDGEFTVVLSGINDTGADIIIPVSISGSADNGADITEIGTGNEVNVVIPVGRDSGIINVNALTDGIIENEETVEATLGTPPTGMINGSDTSAIVTVKDAGTIVNITATDGNATEGGNDDGEFTVALSTVNTTGNDIIIPVTITGTAINGTDITEIGSGNVINVVIPNNSDSAVISINALLDEDIEPNETVLAVLGTNLPNGVTEGVNKSATVIVSDSPKITINPISTDDIISSVEDDSDVEITGTTTDIEAGQEVTVELNGNIYTGTVQPDGTWSVTVPAIDAQLLNATETVIADVTDASGNPAPQVTRDVAHDTALPSISINAIAVDDVINAAEDDSDVEITGTTTDVEAGQTVTVELNGNTYTGIVEPDGTWSVTVPAIDAQTLDATETVTADVSDANGNPAPQATRDIEHNTSIPAISIDVISEDDIINAAEDDSDVVISGTTAGIPVGETVTVELNGNTYTGIVEPDGTWSVTVPATDAQALDITEIVTADVTDESGNPAPQATRNIIHETTIPSISIDVIATDDIISSVEDDSDVEITGTTTDVEAGQTVTVELNGNTYTGIVEPDGTWAITVPATDAQALGATETVTADVSDAAGNPASQVTKDIEHDTDLPSITIDPIATDDIISSIEDDSDVEITGTTTDVEAGQTVTVELNGNTYTSTVQPDGTWSVTVLATDAQALDATETVTADVSDTTGNPAPQETRDIVHDTDLPSITIDPIATDDIISSVEDDNDVEITGTTTDVEAGQTVTVELNGKTYTGTVQPDGTWAITVPATDAQALDATETVTADVSDTTGNPASQAIRDVEHDTDLPSITIDPIATDDIISSVEDDNDVEITGTTTDVEAGQTVTVELNGNTYTGIVQPDGTWAITVPTTDAQALDATETVTADVTDTIGNPAPQATRDVEHDTDLPSITINPIAIDDIINATEDDSDVEISGITTDVEAGQTVTVELNGNTYTGTVQPDGTWSITVPATDAQALDATETVTADVSDASGNPAPQTTRDIAHDEVIPSISIDAIAVDDVINAAEDDQDVEISGTTTDVEAGQTVTVELNGNTYTGTVQPDGTWSVTVPAIDAQALDAMETVTADVSDASGNVAPQTTRDVEHNTSIPAISIDVISGDDIINAVEDDTDVIVSGNTAGIPAGQTVTVELNGNTYTGTVQPDGTWNVTVPATDAQALDTTETVTADVTDGSGNSAPQATRDIAHDTDLPSITINPIATDDIISSVEDDSDVEITGTTTDVEAGQTVTVELNGNTYTGTVQPDGTWSVTVPAVDAQALDTTETVTADVSDAAGNPASQATRDVNHDTTLPSITIDPIATDDIISSVEDDTDVEISGITTDIEAGQEVTVVLNGNTYTGTVQADGTWSIIVPATDAQALDATETVTADVTDTIGNPAPQATRDVEHDTDLPSITINPIAIDDIINAIEDDSDVEISGTTTDVEAGQTVTVELNGNTYTGTVQPDGTWSITVPATDAQALDAQETVIVDVSDASGNPAPQATRDIVHDATIPTISIDIIAGDDVINGIEDNDDVEISGTTTDVEEGQEVTVELNGNIYTGIVQSDGSWSIIVSAIDVQALDANETVTADVSDASGNAAVQTDRDISKVNDSDGDGVSDDDEDLNGDGDINNDDSDGDGTPDYLDTDDDGDGVPTKDEDVDGDGDATNDDSDGDNIPDYLDTDDDGDGVPTKDEDVDGDGDATNDDSDGDNIPDYLDTDDDGDGVPTKDEDVNGDGDATNDDSDGDSTPDYLDTDDDGDGVPTKDEDVDGDGDATNDDSDGDSTPDYLDTDDDGDGIPTKDEDVDGDGDATNDDSDGDNIPDYLDTDDDGDGVPTKDEDVNGDGDATNDDSDGDSTPDYLDTDDDGDGVPTKDEDVDGDGDATNDDSDGDSTPDYLDTDDDGDGIPTKDEDVDGDGDATNDDSDGDNTPDYLDTDDDGDGVPTKDEDVDGDGDATNDDSDGDSTPDYLDTDDDGDGVPTKDEDVDGDGDATNDDSDGDSTPDYLDTDDDDDGIPTKDEDVDNDGDATNDDSDGDSTPDYLDTDDDDDGIPTKDEDVDGDGDATNDDSDGDSTPDYLDTDDDGDGVQTKDENPDVNNDGDVSDAQDTDNDMTPDYLDTDDDGDGVPTKDEDVDGDGDATNDDSDGDSTPDYLDTDDDGDGVLTENENPDTNGDGNSDDAQDSDGDNTPDYLDTDDDGDGISTENENPDTNGDGNSDDAQDSDSDNTPDYLDTDDDGDGISTENENPDTNGDGNSDDAQDSDGDATPDYLDTDDDGDGVQTKDENPDANDDGNPDDAQDTDKDDTPDYLDTDDDEDGELTKDEDSNNDGDLANDDSDGDSTPDYLDSIEANDDNAYIDLNVVFDPSDPDQLDINVLHNDIYRDGKVSVEIIAQGTNGDITINADNTVTYTLNKAVNVSDEKIDEFTYRICDTDSGHCNDAIVEVFTPDLSFDDNNIDYDPVISLDDPVLGTNGEGDTIVTNDKGLLEVKVLNNDDDKIKEDVSGEFRLLDGLEFSLVAPETGGDIISSACNDIDGRCTEITIERESMDFKTGEIKVFVNKWRILKGSDGIERIYFDPAERFVETPSDIVYQVIGGVGIIGEATVSVELLPVIDLEVKIDVDNKTPEVEEIIEFTVSITNNSNDGLGLDIGDANNIRLENIIPNGYRFIGFIVDQLENVTINGNTFLGFYKGNEVRGEFIPNGSSSSNPTRAGRFTVVNRPDAFLNDGSGGTIVWTISKLLSGELLALNYNAEIVKPEYDNTTGELIPRNYDNVVQVTDSDKLDIDSLFSSLTIGSDEITKDTTAADDDEDVEDVELQLTDTALEFVELLTPNGDGSNDGFEIDNLPNVYPNFEMVIFNRYGSEVYRYKHTTGPAGLPDWWDGFSHSGGTEFRSNEQLPVGTYFYILYKHRGTEKPIQGWIYLNR